ncbi:MAG: hypothetical protein RLZZ366_2368, partial [Pseudomonadota bacterium]
MGLEECSHIYPHVNTLSLCFQRRSYAANGETDSRTPI